MSRKTKTPEQIIREIVNPKPPRRKKAKSEADLWYEKMLKEHVTSKGEHLKTALAKIKSTECNCGVGDVSKAAHNFGCPKRMMSTKELLRSRR